MGIRFYCPNGHKLNVKEFQAGRRGICPYCGARTEIPTRSTRKSSKEERAARRAAALAARAAAAGSGPQAGGPASAGTSDTAAAEAPAGPVPTEMPVTGPAAAGPFPAAPRGGLGAGDPAVSAPAAVDSQGPRRHSTPLSPGGPATAGSITLASGATPQPASGVTGQYPAAPSQPAASQAASSQSVAIEPPASQPAGPQAVGYQPAAFPSGAISPPGGPATTPAASQRSVSDPLAEAGDVVWYVRPASGGQFGPASSEIMRTWIEEGRVAADSLVWREGWRDWQEAAEVFPHVAAGQPPVPAPAPSKVSTAEPHDSVATTPTPRTTPRRQSKNTQAIVISILILAVVILFVVFIWVLTRDTSAGKKPQEPAPAVHCPIQPPLAPAAWPEIG